MASKGLLFDVSEMAQETKRHYFPERSSINYVLIGFNSYHSEIVKNFCYTEPSFEEPESILYLDADHYTQLLMLEHLDWDTIQQYFEPLNLRKPT